MQLNENTNNQSLRWIATVIVSLAVLMPPSAQAQTCKLAKGGGCAAPGTPCGPVDSGFGTTGKCTTTGPANDHSCSCEGAALPPVDPKCSDPTAKGQIVCTINQPVVTQRETTYSAVVFVPGDRVTVAADGCVQTGGRGLTWKRYVNPSGPNSDRLYHGLIQIPTANQNALVRIGTVIGRTFIANASGVLHLGYEDDAYSDNGYYAHDNGTSNQCKTDTAKHIDGGPAHVTITINR